MIQRAITFVILFSMMLHCAARLGVLSYLYENRNDIANTLGLISEVPIAMCSSDYDFQKGLHIQHADDHHSLAASFLNAQEINLFFEANIPFQIQNVTNVEVNQKSIDPASYYLQPFLEIFQPPRIA